MGALLCACHRPSAAACHVADQRPHRRQCECTDRIFETRAVLTSCRRRLGSQGSRYKLTYDGMYHFDIPKTRQYDTGKIEVIARSSVGEALATTELKVVQRKDDYRGVLKNSPRRKYHPPPIT